MTKSARFRPARSALAAALALGITGGGALAAAAPPPTLPPRTDPNRPSPTSPTTLDPTPSPTPGDLSPPTGGSMPMLNKARTPGGGAGRITATPSDPATTAGILNEHDIPGKATLSTRDARAAQRALQELHKVNALEIALGALARDKAESSAVKDYATELVESHQASDKRLREFASSHGFVLTDTATAAAPRETLPAGTDTAIPVDRKVPGAALPNGDRGSNPPGAARAVASDANPPAELDAEGRRILAKLQSLEGDKFDRQFLTTMVSDHGKALGKIKAFEKQQKNADIAGLLSDVRTMVEHHLDRAKSLLRPGSVDASSLQRRPLGVLERP